MDHRHAVYHHKVLQVTVIIMDMALHQDLTIRSTVRRLDHYRQATLQLECRLLDIHLSITREVELRFQAVRIHNMAIREAIIHLVHLICIQEAQICIINMVYHRWVIQEDHHLLERTPVSGLHRHMEDTLVIAL